MSLNFRGHPRDGQTKHCLYVYPVFIFFYCGKPSRNSIVFISNCTKKHYVIKCMCENVHAVIMNLELFRDNIDRNERIYYAIKFYATHQNLKKTPFLDLNYSIKMLLRKLLRYMYLL